MESFGGLREDGIRRLLEQGQPDPSLPDFHFIGGPYVTMEIPDDV